jgi:hypothetical protein
MWSFEFTVQCAASRDFAWQFWTDVRNWPVVDPSVESASIDGPFRSGARGTTRPRGADLVHWQLADVREGHSAVVIITVPGAALRFSWKFEDSDAGGVRLTQQASLEGDRAQDYMAAIVPQMEKGMPAGMRKIAAAIEHAASRSE